MIAGIIRWFYCLSYGRILLLVLLALLVWFLVKKLCGTFKWWKATAGFLLVAAVLAVLYIALGQRWEYTEAQKPNLIPFCSYYVVFSGGNPEIYRTNFMNLLMFFPLGLLTFEVFPEGWKHRTKILLSVLIFMLLSVTIEYLQYRFALGLTETDDVIHNTLGAVLGCCTGIKMTDLCSMRKNRRGEAMYQRNIKRFLDVILSGCGIVVLAIPMAMIALAVKLDSKGPVLFWQKRIGIHKTTYQMPKFRSMYTTAPANMPTHMLTSPEQWITPVGKVLRKTSLDELPQLFSIFCGHMSIVGPRPALWNQDDLIAERDKYGANNVRPGLTGWAQVNGRDELPIEVKARFDGEYVQNLTFAMDCKCFFQTIMKVFSHDGVVEGGTGKLEADKQKERIKK